MTETIISILFSLCVGMIILANINKHIDLDTLPGSVCALIGYSIGALCLIIFWTVKQFMEKD